MTKTKKVKEMNQYDPRALYAIWLGKEVKIIGDNYEYNCILRYVSQFEITIELEGKFIVLFKHSITQIQKLENDK